MRRLSGRSGCNCRRNDSARWGGSRRRRRRSAIRSGGSFGEASEKVQSKERARLADDGGAVAGWRQ